MGRRYGRSLHRTELAEFSTSVRSNSAGLLTGNDAEVQKALGAVHYPKLAEFLSTPCEALPALTVAGWAPTFIGPVEHDSAAADEEPGSEVVGEADPTVELLVVAAECQARAAIEELHECFGAPYIMWDRADHRSAMIGMREIGTVDAFVFNVVELMQRVTAVGEAVLQDMSLREKRHGARLMSGTEGVIACVLSAAHFDDVAVVCTQVVRHIQEKVRIDDTCTGRDAAGNYTEVEEWEAADRVELQERLAQVQGDLAAAKATHAHLLNELQAAGNRPPARKAKEVERAAAVVQAIEVQRVAVEALLAGDMDMDDSDLDFNVRKQLVQHGKPGRGVDYAAPAPKRKSKAPPAPCPFAMAPPADVGRTTHRRYALIVPLAGHVFEAFYEDKAKQGDLVAVFTFKFKPFQEREIFFQKRLVELGLGHTPFVQLRIDETGTFHRHAVYSAAGVKMEWNEDWTKRLDKVFAVPPCAVNSMLAAGQSREKAAQREKKGNMYLHGARRFARNHLQVPVFLFENAPNIVTGMGDRTREQILSDRAWDGATFWKLDNADIGLPSHRVRGGGCLTVGQKALHLPIPSLTRLCINDALSGTATRLDASDVAAATAKYKDSVITCFIKGVAAKELKCQEGALTQAQLVEFVVGEEREHATGLDFILSSFALQAQFRQFYQERKVKHTNSEVKMFEGAVQKILAINHNDREGEGRYDDVTPVFAKGDKMYPTVCSKTSARLVHPTECRFLVRQEVAVVGMGLPVETKIPLEFIPQGVAVPFVREILQTLEAAQTYSDYAVVAIDRHYSRRVAARIFSCSTVFGPSTGEDEDPSPPTAAEDDEEDEEGEDDPTIPEFTDQSLGIASPGPGVGATAGPGVGDKVLTVDATHRIYLNRGAIPQAVAEARYASERWQFTRSSICS